MKQRQEVETITAARERVETSRMATDEASRSKKSGLKW